MLGTGDMVSLNRKLDGIKPFLTAQTLANASNTNAARDACTNNLVHPSGQCTAMRAFHQTTPVSFTF